MTGKKKPKKIITDGWGVWVNSKGHSTKSFLDYADRQSLSMREEIVTIYDTHRNRSYTDPDYSYEDAIRDVCKELDIDADAFLEENSRHTTTELAPGAKESLQQLHEQGVEIYFLTDFDRPTSHVEGILEDLGIRKYFAAVISSKDVGHTKPSSETFAYVHDTYGLDQGNSVFLGHALDELEGAHQLGFPTVAVFYEPDDPLDFVDRKLAALEDLVFDSE
ncbi:HAD family hydrolase [Nanoarchaeota archaeon]